MPMIGAKLAIVDEGAVLDARRSPGCRRGSRGARRATVKVSAAVAPGASGWSKR